MAIYLFILDEEWHMSMYDYARSVSKNAIFFWIFLIITGELLIMKLFLAIYINNYMKIVQESGVFQDGNLD